MRILLLLVYLFCGTLLDVMACTSFTVTQNGHRRIDASLSPLEGQRETVQKATKHMRGRVGGPPADPPCVVEVTNTCR